MDITTVMHSEDLANSNYDRYTIQQLQGATVYDTA